MHQVDAAKKVLEYNAEVILAYLSNKILDCIKQFLFMFRMSRQMQGKQVIYAYRGSNRLQGFIYAC